MYKIDKLIKAENQLYHTNDLAILWGISNRNTLYTTIKRYVSRGVLLPIHKGLYATVPLSQLDPLELGRAIIHRYCYLSAESVLAQAGVIAQVTYPYTFVSSVSQKISLDSISYFVRKLKDEFLMNPVGITLQNGVLTATPERAAADLLYFDHQYHFDFPGTLDLENVKDIQKEVGYI